MRIGRLGDGGIGAVIAYYLYKATNAVEFYRPIMFIYFLAQGLTFTEIAILEALYNLTTVFGEVPTGYLGDRVGRRNSLLIGTVLITVTLVGIGLAESFPAFAGLYIVWSLGYTFRSGSEDAWLYDTLSDAIGEERFTHVRGRGESVALGIGVVAAVIGGYLGGIDLSYPWFVAAAVTSLGVFALLAMGEPATYRESGSDRLGVRRTLGIVRDAIGRRDLRSFILYYYVLFAAVTYLVFIFLQPVFESVVVGLGVPRSQVEPLLGWFYGGYSLLGAALSYYAGTIKERIGLRTWFLVLPFGIGGALIAMFIVPILALPTLMLTRGIVDVTRSLAGQFVNDRIETVGRATVLSAMAMVSGLTVVPFQLGSGVLSDLVSPLFALAVGGATLVVGAALILLWEPPISVDRGALRHLIE